MFRNNNPDKGTETFYLSFPLTAYICLEIITPIRGRKQFQVNVSILFPYFRLEIITPIRGRKLSFLISIDLLSLV